MSRTGGVLIHAAGGVLWRPRGPQPELAVVHRSRYDDWTLPKGKLDPGEHPLMAACREVHEETGLPAIAARQLGQVEYVLEPDRKTVDYWEMTVPPGVEPAAFVANDEVDGLRWVRPPEAARLLSYDRDRVVLRAFLAAPPTTALLLLVRHARAGDRRSWHGTDALRPLDSKGRRQAGTLRTTLRCFGPERVLSAGIVRCVETVAPLAADLRVPVQVEPALAEETFYADPERGLARIGEIAAGGGRTVLCSQGGVIPDAVTALAAASSLPLDPVRAGKASVWAMSFVDGKLTAADYYRNLAGPRGEDPTED